VQKPRLDDVKIFSDVSLADNNLVLPHHPLLHSIQHSCPLLLVQVTEDEIVSNRYFDSTKLIGGLGIDWERFIGAAVHSNRFSTDRCASGKNGRCWGV
jgi:hypothetical protein